MFCLTFGVQFKKRLPFLFYRVLLPVYIKYLKECLIYEKIYGVLEFFNLMQ